MLAKSFPQHEFFHFTGKQSKPPLRRLVGLGLVGAFLLINLFLDQGPRAMVIPRALAAPPVIGVGRAPSSGMTLQREDRFVVQGNAEIDPRIIHLAPRIDDKILSNPYQASRLAGPPPAVRTPGSPRLFLIPKGNRVAPPPSPMPPPANLPRPLDPLGIPR